MGSCCVDVSLIVILVSCFSPVKLNNEQKKHVRNLTKAKVTYLSNCLWSLIPFFRMSFYLWDGLNWTDNLALSWRKSLSYRKQSIDLLFKSVDWFVQVRDHRHERVKMPYLLVNILQVMIKSLLWPLSN